MNVKMISDRENKFNNSSFNNYDRNFNAPRIMKPKPGLSLTELENIPKFLKSKNVLSNISNFNPVTNKSNTKENSVDLNKNLNNKSVDKSRDKDSKSKRDLSKNLSNSYLTIKSSRDKLRSSSNNKISSSPSKISKNKTLYKSSKCHRYHTDLDFNYLTGEKFMIDSLSCGKEKLQGVALKNSSPNKYYQDNRLKNDIDPNLNWVKNLNPNVNSNWYNSADRNDDTLKISNIDNEYLNNSKQIAKKSSKGILCDVLDYKFSVNSPSKMKKYQDEILQMKNEEYLKGMQMSMQKENEKMSASNFNKLNNFNPSASSEIKNKIYVEDEKNAKLTVNLSYFGEDPSERFILALQNVLSQLDPVFENMTHSQKVEKFLDLSDDQRRSIRLGALVALYIFLKKYQIEETLKQNILEKILYHLTNYESQEELFLVACHEICCLYSKNDLLIENLNLICMFLTDFNFPILQKSAFNCLMCMEYEGIRALVELASKDHKDYQQYILSNLLNTPHIQKIIIIRALLNEIYSNTAERRHSALAALNRLHDMIGDKETLGALAKFFDDHRIEKIFLSSTLRTAGIKGEKILLNEIKCNKDYSVRVAIASVFDYRVPRYPKYLKMRLDNNDAYSLTKNTPGKFCTYYGKVSPYVHEVKSDNEFYNDGEEEFLEVSTRDFLASLQRMLSMNYDHFNPKIVHRGSPFWLDSLNLKTYVEENVKEDYNEKENILKKYLNVFDLIEEDLDINNRRNQTESISYSQQELNERGEYLISEDVIKALCVCLKDYSTAVRDTAAGTLGRIGLPEGLLSIDQLIDCIKDQDVNVKSKIIWTIGRISPGCDNSVIPYVVDALKSNMWKVKCACFYALSQFGSRSARQAIPSLVKLLRESAINKQTIAETIVKLGSEGENTLINLMNTETDSNYKLKSIIAKSLALSNINSPNIDFIVECLFKSAKSNSSLIRQNSLFGIRVLAEKAEEKITYLKRKNLIPFYYEMMMDKEQAIQAYAISCIKSLGPQGELIFIEGLTRDSNPLIRQNSAIGLCQMGPQTLRTLLIGLHDENIQVKKIVEKEIIENFSIQRILEYFTPERSSHRMSLKIAIREILEKQLAININTIKFLQNLLIALEKEYGSLNYIDEENYDQENPNQINQDFDQRDDSYNYKKYNDSFQYN